MNKIINADSIEYLKTLPSDSVDLIVADPPYNLGKNYGNNHDLKGFEEYLEFSKQWLTEARRVLKNDGTIYVFMGVRFISYLYDTLDRDLKMFFNSWITWFYTQGIGKTKGFSPRHDDILMFTKSEKFKFNLDAIRVPQKFYRTRNNMRGANPGNVWEFSHVHYCNESREKHPTQKPEGIIERMILASTNEGDVVLDPFAGSGTTPRVAKVLNRKYIGIELNPDYVDMINRRVERPFEGFDSIDVKVKRIPNDLRNESIRNDYLANHKIWFLNFHKNSYKEFYKMISDKYGKEALDSFIAFEENTNSENDVAHIDSAI